MAKTILARDVAAVARGETLSCLWESGGQSQVLLAGIDKVVSIFIPDLPHVQLGLVIEQPPPPTGLENNALEHSLDLQPDDQGMNAVHTSQNGYGNTAATQGPQEHNINGGEWVNMSYMGNSYSNSNNGGSVDFQDSWQMKMAAQANNSNNINPDHRHHLVDRFVNDI
ncbi:unnamed protein product [Timema podura]|uniref:Uncharacterized protein n=1 Tax=Timema podura TaxID=61482 RepID=A0ABN7P2M3_TIMPD|nr:unnamed protein product [Timema podura]